MIGSEGMEKERARTTLRSLVWEAGWNVMVISVKYRSWKEEQISGDRLNTCRRNSSTINQGISKDLNPLFPKSVLFGPLDMIPKHKIFL